MVAPQHRIQLPPLSLEGHVRADTFDPETRTATVVWTTGATVRRGFFTQFDEKLDLSPGAIRMERFESGRAPVLNAHGRFDLGDVLGVIESASHNRREGTARVRFSERNDEIRALVDDIAAGIIRNVSVGYRVWQFRDITKKGDEVRTLLAIDWEPFEVSFVPVGADPGAAARGIYLEHAAERREDLAPNACTVHGGPALILTQANPEPAMTKPTTDPQQTPATPPATGPQTGGGEGQRGEATPAPTPTPAPAPAAPAAPAPQAGVSEAERQQIAEQAAVAERQRQADIRTAAGLAGVDVDSDFVRDLIDNGRSIDDARRMLLEERGRQEELPANQTSGQTRTEVGEEGRAKLHRALEDSLSLRSSYQETPDAERLQGNPFVHLTLMEAGRMMLEQAGVDTRAMTKMQLAGAILGNAGIRALHGTSDFPLILANTANKTLQAQYESTPQTFAAWVRRGTLPDFKSMSRTKLGSAPMLQEVPPGAEFQRGSIGEEAESILLLTYGRIFGMTRQMMVNDDLDAFDRLPAAYGAQARNLESDLVYGHLTGNTAMADGNPLYSAQHANLSTGVLSVTGLDNARQIMRQQLGIDPGNGEAKTRINATPRHLRVPTALETVAQQLTTAIQAQQVGEVNVFQGAFESVAAEPRLDATSLVQYYLFGSPSQGAAVEISFLQGETGPRVETRVGFDVDGMEVKAAHDVGTAPIEFRNTVRSSGA